MVRRIAAVLALWLALASVAGAAEGWARYQERVKERQAAGVTAIDKVIADTKAKIEIAKKGLIDRRLSEDVAMRNYGKEIKFKTAVAKKKYLADLEAAIDAAEAKKKPTAAIALLPLMTPAKGDIGIIPGGDPWVDYVIDAMSVVVKVNYVFEPSVRDSTREVPFVFRDLGAGELMLVVSGVPTDSSVDDKPIALKGLFEIVGTKKVGGRSMWEIRPFTLPPE